MKITLTAALAGLPLVTPAAAHVETMQIVCMPITEQMERSKKEFGESPAFDGFTVDGKLRTMVFLSPKGSYTIVFATPYGMSCVLNSGVDFRPIAQGDPA